MLCRSEGPAVVLEVLNSLARVGRFDMAIMFMSSAEKEGEREFLCCALWHVHLSLLLITDLV